MNKSLDTKNPYVPTKQPFTRERKVQFLEYLTSHPDIGGRPALCAQAVGVSLSTVGSHRKNDPAFNEAVVEAQQFWAENYLLSAAIERAVVGVEKSIYGGKYKDQVVGTERVYSDSLLSMMLKAKLPEFKTESNVNVTQNMAGGVLVIPSAPASPTEWQQQFGELALGKGGQEQA